MITPISGQKNLWKKFKKS